MIHRTLFVVAVLLAIPHAADAQAGHNQAGHSEHAGKESREIKALAPSAMTGLLSEDQIERYDSLRGYRD